MGYQSIRQSMSVLGVTQAELAREAGLSEAAISRQLSGDLRLSDPVRRTALRLIRERAIIVGRQILAHYGLDRDLDDDAEE